VQFAYTEEPLLKGVIGTTPSPSSGIDIEGGVVAEGSRRITPEDVKGGEHYFSWEVPIWQQSLEK